MAEAPEADGALPFDPALPPTSSLFLYLRAEQALPAARSGTTTPLAGVCVDSNRLAITLFAVALWRLREAGLVTLELQQERHFFKTTRSVRILPAPAAAGIHRDGIEGGILGVLMPGSPLRSLTPAWEAMPDLFKRWNDQYERRLADVSQLQNLPAVLRDRPKAEPQTVSQVISQWYGASHGAIGVPISWTVGEGVAKGLLSRVDAGRNPIAAFFRGRTKIAVLRGRTDPLEGQIAELLARWQAFKAAEGDLAAQLERDIDAIIDLRAQPPDGSAN